MKKKSSLYVYNMVVQFFLETFVAMVLGYLLGKWLDEKFFDERVILTYIFVLLGIFAGLRNLIVRALSFSKGEDCHDEEERHH